MLLCLSFMQAGGVGREDSGEVGTPTADERVGFIGEERPRSRQSGAGPDVVCTVGMTSVVVGYVRRPRSVCYYRILARSSDEVLPNVPRLFARAPDQESMGRRSSVREAPPASLERDRKIGTFTSGGTKTDRQGNAVGPKITVLASAPRDGRPSAREVRVHV